MPQQQPLIEQVKHSIQEWHYFYQLHTRDKKTKIDNAKEFDVMMLMD